ncbi:MAG: AAA family ATPase [Hyphomonadaceae bacterium]
MDPAKNPFSPGAGNPPPELAGREDILNEAKTTIARVADGRHSRSQMLLGLRGVGKTVLLNEIESMADERKLLTAIIEAPESKTFLEKLAPQLRKVIIKLDRVAALKKHANDARVALRNFLSVFKVKYEGVELGVDPEPGIADSGDLSSDLTDLLLLVAQAAAKGKTAVVLLVDEVQYLSEDELTALIVALHRISQKNLPFVVFGAGLPQLAGLAGEAKSYAERLFDYPTVGALEKSAATDAIKLPIEKAGARIDRSALAKILKETQGYPFFLQEWGYQAWNAASTKTITTTDVVEANKAAIKRLDRGFFRVRLDRMTPREQEYMRAMAELGAGPHRSGDIAAKLGISVRTAAPLRNTLIDKGMIYSPAHGDTAFTVPMFDAYLRRAVLRLDNNDTNSKKRPRKRKT